MIDAEIQLDRRNTRRRVDRDRERCLAAVRAFGHDADHDSVDQLELDRRTVGQGQRRVGPAELELITQPSAGSRAIRAELDGGGVDH